MDQTNLPSTIWYENKIRIFPNYKNSIYRRNICMFHVPTNRWYQSYKYAYENAYMFKRVPAHLEEDWMKLEMLLIPR